MKDEKGKDSDTQSVSSCTNSEMVLDIIPTDEEVNVHNCTTRSEIGNHVRTHGITNVGDQPVFAALALQVRFGRQICCLPRCRNVEI